MNTTTAQEKSRMAPKLQVYQRVGACISVAKTGRVGGKMEVGSR
jgi:hypothetical protein